MKAIISETLLFVKNHIFVTTIVVIAFLSFILFISSFNFMNNDEVVIPGLYKDNGGVVNGSASSEKVIEFNPKYKDIVLTNGIRSYQKAVRYLKVEGKIKFYEKVSTDFYRSVIFEIDYGNSGKRDFYFFPVSNGRFSGYLYFTKKGDAKVVAYVFYDSSISTKKEFVDTTASIGFQVNVMEAVPENLSYLLPTKNVNNGNRQIRNLALKITENESSNLNKAKKIYEYLIFGDGNDNYDFHKYKKTVLSCRAINYHNTYIASQILKNKGGVCNDFAEVYAALLRSVDIKVKKISGFTDYTRSCGHMWNLVDLTGDERQWMKVDASWANVDRNNYKKWAEFYTDYDDDYFENKFKPMNHGAFNYDRVIEY